MPFTLSTSTEAFEEESSIEASSEICFSKDLDIDSKQEEVKIDKTISSQNLHELKAPLVGTYYSSPKPDSPQFVNVGDKVSQGQTVCIIEAMKIFNEIESDVNGIVSEICIENGKPVEFDQLILKIKPE